MEVKVTDHTMFGQLELHIKAQSIEEIWGVLATFNVRTAKRLEDFPGHSDLYSYEYREKAIRAIEMPLWNAVSPVFKKLEKAYNDTKVVME